VSREAYDAYNAARHRPAQRRRRAEQCLATAVLIIGKLIDWRDRWSPT
jgi:hypothetical protein